MIFLANKPECLANFILLKDGCYVSDGAKIEAPTPTSGYYIESLQGISIENMADITPENIDTTNLVNGMVYWAADIVQKRLTGYLAGNGYDLNKRGESFKSCKETSIYEVPVAIEKGIRVSRAAINTDRGRIFVEQIRAKSKIDGSAVFKIEDIDGNVLWSETVNMVADTEMIKNVNKQFDEEIVYILIDSTNVSLYQYNCNNYSGCCGNAKNNNKDLAVMGFDGVQNSFTGFCAATLRLDCTDKNFICEFRDRLALSILFQTGAEILKEWASPSSRINLTKNFGMEWAMETAEKYEQQSIEYMNAEIRNIQQMLSYDQYCYNCNNNFRTKPILP